MKKVSVILFIFCSLCLNIYSQENQSWKWLHPQPQGNAINWFKAWDSNNWYALGNARTFMKTTNAGASWYFHHNTGN
ncbi:MAG: hypothetical protein Q8903_09110, partial [Bacteroidota bacterium]|nr:hypothetical protein [Bacteroidota bacterium]